LRSQQGHQLVQLRGDRVHDVDLLGSLVRANLYCPPFFAAAWSLGIDGERQRNSACKGTYQKPNDHRLSHERFLSVCCGSQRRGV
jgi:hypothetical protein